MLEACRFGKFHRARSHTYLLFVGWLVVWPFVWLLLQTIHNYLPQWRRAGVL